MASISQSKELTPFTALDLRAFGEVSVEQAEPGAAATVVIEAAEAIMPKLRTEVRDGRLILGFDLKWWEWATWWFQWMRLSDKTLRYRIKTTGLEEIRLTGSASVEAPGLRADSFLLRITGSGKVKLENLEAQKLSVNISGSGDLFLSGRVEQQEIKISGSAKVDAEGLECGRTQIGISGSGSTKVYAKDELTVKITGSGSVRYIGSPQTVNQQISGSGRLEKIG